MRARTIWAIAMVCAMAIATTAPSGAQQLTGNVMSKVFHEDLEIQGVSMNEDGTYAVLEFEEQFWGISIDEGKTLWTRELKDDYDNKFDGVYWVSASEAIVPLDSEFEFISFPDGKSLAKVKAPIEDMSELVKDVPSTVAGTDIVGIKRIGNLLLLPFEDSYLVVSLRDRSVLVSETEPLEDIRHDFWGQYMFLWGSMDNAYLFDLSAASVVKKFNNKSYKVDGPEVHADIYQRFMVADGVAVMFFDDAFASFSAADGSQKAEIPISPMECETYKVLVTDVGPNLILQRDGIVECYDLLNGQRMWATPEVDEPGLLMQAWTLEGAGDFLMTRIDSDEMIHLSRVDPKTGTRKWDIRLVASEFGYESGHYHSVTFGEALSTTLGGNRGATLSSSQTGFRSYILDSLGYQTYFSQMGVDSVGTYTEQDILTLFTENCIHEESEAYGVVRYLGSTDGNIGLLTQGRLHKAWEAGKPEMAEDGEAVLTIDMETGAVKKAIPVPMFRDSEKDKYPLFWTWQPLRTPQGWIVQGSHTFLRIGPNMEVDTIGFVTEERIYRKDAGIGYMTFSYMDPDDRYILEQIDYSGAKLQRNVIGIAYDDKTFGLLSDTTFVNVTLVHRNDQLEAYDVQHDVTASWGTPKWTMTEDQLEALDVGSFDISPYDVTRGIHQWKDRIFIVGDEALATVGAADGCTNVTSWEGYSLSPIQHKYRRFQPFLNGSGFWDLGDDVGVFGGTGCALDLKGKYEWGRDDAMVVFTRKTNTVMFCDMDQNKLDVFRLD